MLELAPYRLVGKGEHRECYVHPHRNDLCVKVAVDDEGYKETAREQAYYKRLMERNISWSAVPRFYGNTETNLGSGGIFDLIRDFDGRVSTKSLTHYISSVGKTERNYAGLSQAFLRLKDTLLQEKIVTGELKPTNILYRKINDAEGVFVVIDDIRNTDLIPAADYIDFLARKKILRKWDRFELTLLRRYPSNILLHRMLTRNIFACRALMRLVVIYHSLFSGCI
jgi:hypothetical protein